MRGQSCSRVESGGSSPHMNIAQEHNGCAPGSLSKHVNTYSLCGRSCANVRAASMFNRKATQTVFRCARALRGIVCARARVDKLTLAPSETVVGAMLEAYSTIICNTGEEICCVYAFVPGTSSARLGSL